MGSEPSPTAVRTVEEAAAPRLLQTGRDDDKHHHAVLPRVLAYSMPDPFMPLNRNSVDYTSSDDDDDDASSTAASAEAAEGDANLLKPPPSGHEYKEFEDSSDDEKTRLVGDGGIGLEEGDDKWAAKVQHAKRRRLLLPAISLLVFIVLSATFLGSHAFSGRHTFHGGGLSPITWEHVANGTFNVERRTLDWLAEAGDGVYSYRTQDGSIVLHDVRVNSTRFLVKSEDVKVDGRSLAWRTFKVSADLKYIIFTSGYEKQWRHSSHSHVYVHDLETGATTLLHRSDYKPSVAIATFSPVNHHIAYVHNNDLYVHDRPPTGDADRAQVIRVTNDGSATTFNGVPDWVYEEEVFSSDTATWWAPDASKLAYLSFDEQHVPEYDFPIYNPNQRVPGGVPYPESTIMRYPKPGYPNPIVQIHVFDLVKYLALSRSRPSSSRRPQDLDSRVVASTFNLQFDKTFDKTDLLITEVTWVGKDDLIVKFSNRISTIQRVAHFKLDRAVEEEGDVVVFGKVVREQDWQAIDGGWAEPGQHVVGIDSSIMLHTKHSDISAPIPSYPPGYLDIVPDSAGFSHLAFFSPPDSPNPVFLTNGQWEIEDSIQAVDVVRGLVYFIAANPATERHLHSVPLPTVAQFEVLKTDEPPATPRILTNTSAQGYYRTSFSPFAGFYVLNYDGPKVPWQHLVDVESDTVLEVLADNSKLAEIASELQSPELHHTTVAVDGVELNALELRPPQMDSSGRTKYPVLFSVYGGPASQVVNTIWKRDWHYYLCTTYSYVVVFVDPRGTGYKGREFRAPVHGRLGLLEASDTIAAARYWTTLPYVDAKRVGIWGWSYGGFLTSKVIEADSSVFTLGMAVAPVTSWTYYDSIYTERYMMTPELNAAGYENSSVTRMDGFKHAKFALAHGSGDDNVHFLNSANLLDRLTFAGVKDFAFRLFIDSDHSMSMRGQYFELMPWLSSFLYDNWGDGARTKQKWKTKHANSRLF